MLTFNSHSAFFSMLIYHLNSPVSKLSTPNSKIPTYNSFSYDRYLFALSENQEYFFNIFGNETVLFSNCDIVILFNFIYVSLQKKLVIIKYIVMKGLFVRIYNELQKSNLNCDFVDP